MNWRTLWQGQLACAAALSLLVTGIAAVALYKLGLRSPYLGSAAGPLLAISTAVFTRWLVRDKKPAKPKPQEFLVSYSIQGPAARELAVLYVDFYSREKHLDVVARQKLWARVYELLSPPEIGQRYALEPYKGLATHFQVDKTWVGTEPPAQTFVVIDTTPKTETDHA